MVPRKEIYCQLPLETATRLPELLEYYGAPSISKLVEEALKYWIEQMDIERKEIHRIS